MEGGSGPALRRAARAVLRGKGHYQMCNYKVGDRVQKTDGSTTVYIVIAVYPGRNGSSCTYDIQPDGGGTTQSGVPDGGLKPADD